MNASVSAARPSERIARLEALATELAARGWTTRLHAPRGQSPSLHTRNPEPGAAALSEHIYAHPRTDGTWVYWWPWTDPIADTAADAATVIVRVLRAVGTP